MTSTTATPPDSDHGTAELRRALRIINKRLPCSIEQDHWILDDCVKASDFERWKNQVESDVIIHAGFGPSARREESPAACPLCSIMEPSVPPKTFGSHNALRRHLRRSCDSYWAINRYADIEWYELRASWMRSAGVDSLEAYEEHRKSQILYNTDDFSWPRTAIEVGPRDTVRTPAELEFALKRLQDLNFRTVREGNVITIEWHESETHIWANPLPRGRIDLKIVRPCDATGEPADGASGTFYSIPDSVKRFKTLFKKQIRHFNDWGWRGPTVVPAGLPAPRAPLAPG